MKHYIISIIWLLGGVILAQDNNKINLGAHIPQQVESIPAGAKRLLLNKLGKIITDNGISDDVSNSRFILVPNVSVLTKNITPTAPPKIAITLEITFYVGDGLAGNLFASETLTAKGVGTNELKAYTNAIGRIQTKSKALTGLIEKAKQEILDYYEMECQTVANRASSLEKQGRFKEALFTITNIPESTTCFSKHDQKITSLYKKAIDEDCVEKLNLAQAIWTSNQDFKAANEAGVLLASIRPQASCFSKVQQLYSKISARVKEVSDRGWELTLMEVDLTKTNIEAAREVGVAFGENQPQNVTYNTRGWF